MTMLRFAVILSEAKDLYVSWASRIERDNSRFPALCEEPKMQEGGDGFPSPPEALRPQFNSYFWKCFMHFFWM